MVVIGVRYTFRTRVESEVNVMVVDGEWGKNGCGSADQLGRLSRITWCQENPCAPADQRGRDCQNWLAGGWEGICGQLHSGRLVGLHSSSPGLRLRSDCTDFPLHPFISNALCLDSLFVPVLLTHCEEIGTQFLRSSPGPRFPQEWPQPVSPETEIESTNVKLPSSARRNMRSS